MSGRIGSTVRGGASTSTESLPEPLSLFRNRRSGESTGAPKQPPHDHRASTVGSAVVPPLRPASRTSSYVVLYALRSGTFMNPGSQAAKHEGHPRARALPPAAESRVRASLLLSSLSPACIPKRRNSKRKKTPGRPDY